MRILKYLVVVLLIGIASGKQTFAQANIDRFSCGDPFSLCTERHTTAAWIPNTRADISVTMSPRCFFIRT